MARLKHTNSLDQTIARQRLLLADSCSGASGGSGGSGGDSERLSSSTGGDDDEREQSVHHDLHRQRRTSCTSRAVRDAADRALFTEGSRLFAPSGDDVHGRTTVRGRGGIWARLPRFGRSELVMGDVLGTGEFGVVREIERVVLGRRDVVDANSRQVGYPTTEKDADDGVAPSVLNRDQNDGQNDVEGECCAGGNLPAGDDDGDARRAAMRQAKIRKSSMSKRKFVMEHCVREGGHARYAIKTIRYDRLSDPRQFADAAMDLAIEAHFLSAVEHPNIIKLRGLSVEDPGNRQFFLVVDRLYGTLTERMDLWRSRKKKSGTLVKRIFKDVKRKQKRILWDERLAVAVDLVAALKYLHFRDIIHRDLKPDNIGFDVRGDVKVFDFGLAKEIPPENKKLVDGTYNMSGQTGSIRYMAPEVYVNEPYNELVDVYSLSVVFYEMFSLEKAFEGFDERTMASDVFGRGYRPNLDEHAWPDYLKSIIRRGWSVLFRERPSAADMTDILKEELISFRTAELKAKGDDLALRGLDHTARRSTFCSLRDTSTSAGSSIKAISTSAA